MKSIFTFLSLMLYFLAGAQSSYPGNGNSGFGGVLGTGTLQMSDDGTTVSGTLTKGAANLNDAVVIYINSVAGGFTSTSGFTDEADPLRRAISGVNGANRATVNFTAPFEADYAIAFDQGFGGLWQLVNGGSHNYITSVNLSPTGNPGSATFSFNFNKASIGLGGAINFTFVATYLNPNNAFRADEAIGNGIAGGNPGNPSTVTFTNSLAYPAIVTPIGFTSFIAEKRNGSNLLKWSIEQTGDLNGFTVERSGNGINYTSIAEVAGSPTVNNYSFSDLDPLSRHNFYRIKARENSGIIKYSVIRQLIGTSKANPVILLNNPVKDVVRFNPAGLNPGRWGFVITNNSGQTVAKGSFEKTNDTQIVEVPLPAGTRQGIYYIKVAAGQGVYTQSLIVQ